MLLEYVKILKNNDFILFKLVNNWASIFYSLHVKITE
jgi:hypothetical protein